MDDIRRRAANVTACKFSVLEIVIEIIFWGREGANKNQRPESHHDFPTSKCVLKPKPIT